MSVHDEKGAAKANGSRVRCTKIRTGKKERNGPRRPDSAFYTNSNSDLSKEFAEMKPAKRKNQEFDHLSPAAMEYISNYIGVSVNCDL